MTVSLLEILAAARAHAAPLAAESAGYLLLAVTDHLALSPRAVTAEDVELQTDGKVRLRGGGAAAPAGEAEQIARRLLARTLEVSSSVGPALRRAAERRENTGLDGLVRELEVALIPVNRSAARRALSRINRETARAREQGKLEAWLRAEQAPADAVADPVALAADFPAPTISVTPAPVLPVVAMTCSPPPAAPALSPTAAALPAPSAPPELFLSPPPLPAAPPAAPSPPASPSEEATADELVLTKPEPVVERARARGSSTPTLGTVVTAQTLPEEEQERTERVPLVALDDEPDDLDIPIEVDLEPEVAMAAADDPPLMLEPTPSCLPDVLTAMIELHAGLEPDEAPTRLRDVVTAPRPAQLTPPLEVVDGDERPALGSLQGVSISAEAQGGNAASADVIALVEVADPAVHDALTWNPGPVAPWPAAAAELNTALTAELEPAPTAELERAPAEAHDPAPTGELEPVPAEALEPTPQLPVEPTPLAASLLIAEPVELSPYAPAVLPARESDVSELLDSFHVTSAVEERELRAALKEIAGVDPTPPHPYAQGE